MVASAAPMPTEAVSRPATHKRIDVMCSKLRRRELVGSHATGLETLRLLREVVAGAKFSRFELLCDHLREVGGKLQDAGPKEFVIGNMVRRILNLLREEYSEALQTHVAAQPLSTSQSDTPGSETPSLHTNRNHDFPASFTLTGPPPTNDPKPRKSGEESSATSLFDLLGLRGSAPTLSGADTALGSHSPLSYSNVNSAAPSRASTPPPAANLFLGGTASPKAFNFPITPISPRKGKDELADEFSAKSHSLKPIFIEAIQELYDELETVDQSVAASADEHIHSGEIIMTYGSSSTVSSFLLSASRKRQFHLITPETAPSFSGRALAAKLSTATPPISTLLIPDSSIWALIPRCSKVVIGCHAVMADGSLLARSGTLGLCRAAKAHLVPVVVVTGVYKLTPVYLSTAGGEAGDMGDFDLKDPREVLGEEELQGVGEGGEGGEDGAEVEVLNPYWDRVPKELVDLFITNLGGHPSSIIYKLLVELYQS